MNIKSLFILFLISYTYGDDRKIIPQLNPNCINCNELNQTLLYTQGVGSKDIIHQVWDFTRGTPTVIYAIASLNSTMDIQWEDKLPSKFVLSEKPKYSFALAIDSIIEYDDLHDQGQFDNRYPHKEYTLKNLLWQLKENSETNEEAMVHVCSEAYRYSDGKLGLIDITLDLLPFRDYAVKLPHLIHTSNSSLMDISLVNLTSSAQYNASRFALRLTLVSTDSSNDTMHYAMRKSLDDEHTPGVFEIIEIKTPRTYRDGDGGYVQLRPVAYTQLERNVASSTLVHLSSLTDASMEHRSTLGRFYREYDRGALLLQSVVVSFGEPGDGYYVQHNYTSWSFAMGYGTPPLDSFSFLVIVIISIGLGVPVVLAASGIAYVVVRRLRQRNSPRRFTDE